MKTNAQIKRVFLVAMAFLFVVSLLIALQINGTSVALAEGAADQATAEEWQKVPFERDVNTGVPSSFTFAEPTYYADPEAEAGVKEMEGISWFHSEGGMPNFFSFSAYSGTKYGACNVTFRYPIEDAHLLKSVKIQFRFDILNGAHNEDVKINIPDAEGKKAYYRLYAVNEDGTVQKDKYFEFSDENVPADALGENEGQWTEVTLDLDDIAALTDSADKIETLQWSFYHHTSVIPAGVQLPEGFNYLYIRDISYLYFGEDEYHTVNFYDTDKTTALTPYKTPTYILETPDEEVDGYPKEGNQVEWLTEDGKVFDFSQRITGDINLYASWKAARHTITFDSNGGSELNVTSVTGNYGEEITGLPADPQRTGYRFTGWFEANSDTAYTFDTFERDVNLFAGWEKASYTIHHTVSAENSATVTITGGKTEGVYESKVYFVVQAADGYEISNVVVKDAAGTELVVSEYANGNYAFTMPASEVTIQVETQSTSNGGGGCSGALAATGGIGLAAAVLAVGAVLMRKKKD